MPFNFDFYTGTRKEAKGKGCKYKCKVIDRQISVFYYQKKRSI